jgi:hypothetical protein
MICATTFQQLAKPVRELMFSALAPRLKFARLHQSSLGSDIIPSDGGEYVKPSEFPTAAGNQAAPLDQCATDRKSFCNYGLAAILSRSIAGGPGFAHPPHSFARVPSASCCQGERII